MAHEQQKQMALGGVTGAPLLADDATALSLEETEAEDLIRIREGHPSRKTL